MSNEPLAGRAAAYAAAAQDDGEEEEGEEEEEEEEEEDGEEGEEEDGDVVEAPFFFSPCPSSPSSALSSISAARVNHGALAQYSREHHLSGSGHFILGRTMIAASTGRRTMVSPRAMGAVATRPRRP